MGTTPGLPPVHRRVAAERRRSGCGQPGPDAADGGEDEDAPGGGMRGDEVMR